MIHHDGIIFLILGAHSVLYSGKLRSNTSNATETEVETLVIHLIMQLQCGLVS